MPILAAFRAPGLYLFRFFAGFCLIADGVYIGAGRFLAQGADPWVMTENESPRWLLVAYGLVACPLGLYLWHRQGPHFGLGEAKGNVSKKAALVSTILLLATAAAEMLRNVR